MKKEISRQEKEWVEEESEREGNGGEEEGVIHTLFDLVNVVSLALFLVTSMLLVSTGMHSISARGSVITIQ